MPVETNDLIAAYSRDPVGNYEMKDPSVFCRQGNDLCGDFIVVYLRIDPTGVVEEFSYTGDTSIHTLAAASLLCEYIAGVSIGEILTWGYEQMKQWGFSVSTRRQRSAVTALLATRNALHKRKNDGMEDTYDCLLSS